MFAASHKLIARSVYEILKDQLGITLDCRSLLSGSIAPDINPRMIFLPHTTNATMNIVKTNIDWLKDREIPVTKKDNAAFSYKLGIVIHFLSDYFCKAHNEKRYDNFLHHYIYERKLKIYLEKRMKKCKSLNEFLKPFDWQSGGDIYEFIGNKLQDYNSTERRMSEDIKYSMGVCAAVTLNIASCCISNTVSEILESVA